MERDLPTAHEETITVFRLLSSKTRKIYRSHKHAGGPAAERREDEEDQEESDADVTAFARQHNSDEAEVAANMDEPSATALSGINDIETQVQAMVLGGEQDTAHLARRLRALADWVDKRSQNGNRRDMTGDISTTEDRLGYDLAELPLGAAEEEEERSETEEDRASMETHLPDLPDFESLVEADEPRRLVPPLRPVAASASSGSQGGQERDDLTSGHSSETRSVREPATAGMSAPTQSARSADSDAQAPIIADTSLEPEEGVERETDDNSSQEKLRPLTAQRRPDNYLIPTRSGIIGLADNGPNAYVLYASDSGIQLYRLKHGFEKMVFDFNVQLSDETSSSEYASITVSGAFIVVSVMGSIIIYSEHGVKMGKTDISYCILDMAGTSNSVYCLTDNGEVVEYCVPELERVEVICPSDQTPGTKAIKIDSAYRRVAILYIYRERKMRDDSQDHDYVVVNIYENWEFLVSIFIPIYCYQDQKIIFRPLLSLHGDELLVFGRNRDGRMYYYNIIFASWETRFPTSASSIPKKHIRGAYSGLDEKQPTNQPRHLLQAENACHGDGSQVMASVTRCEIRGEKYLVAISGVRGDQFLVADCRTILEMGLCVMKRKARPCLKRENTIIVPSRYSDMHSVYSSDDDEESDLWDESRSEKDRRQYTLFKAMESTEKELFIFDGFSTDCQRINKVNGELLNITKSGRVTEYGRDVTRQLNSYNLPLPDMVSVRRFDTTDEGEVVAITDEDQLMVFTPDRQLHWNTSIERDAVDIVCDEDKIYVLRCLSPRNSFTNPMVLRHDQVIIHNLYTHSDGSRRTAEYRRLPIGVNHYYDVRNRFSNGENRLAVHGQFVYLMAPKDKVIINSKLVLKINLCDNAPAFTEFINEPRLSPSCMAVTGEGEVVVGGRWEDSNTDTDMGTDTDRALAGRTSSRGSNSDPEAEGDTDSDDDSHYSSPCTHYQSPRNVVLVYSPNGELLRRTYHDRDISDLIVAPGGGLFISYTGDLHFLDDF